MNDQHQQAPKGLYPEQSEDELRAEARRIAHELERRRLGALAVLPAETMATADDLAYIDSEWGDAYMGSLSETDDAKAALEWLWASTVIAHESQYERTPSVGHVARVISEHLTELLLGGGGEDSTDMRDLSEPPGFGGRGCRCRMYDDGDPENGPHLAVDIDSECVLHKHLLEDDQPDYVSEAGTVEGIDSGRLTDGGYERPWAYGGEAVQ